MQYLNGDLELSDLEKMDSQFCNVASAFHGKPVKTPFGPGCTFARLISTSTSCKKDDDSGIFSSPWWQKETAFYQLLSDFCNVDPISVFRGKLAITPSMSPSLDGLVYVTLTRGVYGWVGRARHQEDKNINLCYIGGGEQVFLPHLDAMEKYPPYIRLKSTLSSNFAYISRYNWTNELKKASVSSA